MNKSGQLEHWQEKNKMELHMKQWCRIDDEDRLGHTEMEHN